MTTSKIIYFVTSNKSKFSGLKQELLQIGVELRRLDYDFDEGRELDIQAVASSKLAQAKKAFPGKALVVDDRGFFISALGGFPGPFIKLLLNTFSYPGLIRLMKDVEDRRAVFSYAIGYFNGKEDIILTADEVGFIIDEPRGNNLHGWTELLYVYGYKRFSNRSLAELDDAEWEEYIKATADVDPFVLLKNHLAKPRVYA
jgi:inosine triphosphate pyrophosphatase